MTDIRTDIQTDKAAYRVACSRLKRVFSPDLLMLSSKLVESFVSRSIFNFFIIIQDAAVAAAVAYLLSFMQLRRILFQYNLIVSFKKVLVADESVERLRGWS